MEINIENNKLLIKLVGSLTTTNAQQVEAEINSHLVDSLSAAVIDADNLDYISSAGLRVILALTKKIKDTTVINVNRDVFDVFEMTGFSSFLKIEKKLRELSVEGCPIIGEGANALVYRLDQDTIVKAFKTDQTIEKVREEINLAKKAFLYGVPTAISFDIVKVNGKFGLVFEMIDAKSLCDLMKEDLQHLDKYIQMLIDLLLKLRNTDATGSGLRNAKSFYQDQLEYIKPHLEEKYYNLAKKYLDELEDKPNLVHGDFHIKNIMVQNGEPLLIDMDTISTGDQIFEYGSFYIGYKAYPEIDHSNTMSFFGISYENCDKIYTKSLKGCFPSVTEEQFKDNLMKIQAVGCLRMIYFCYIYNENELRTTTAIKKFYEALDCIDSFKLTY